jgi:glycosyltransferase involved in cell wall biosynthesis
MLEKLDYWVIIPVLNEEESIPLVVQALKELRYPPTQILVADNGSTDKSYQIASESGAICLHEPNKGYGNACMKAIDYIKIQKEQPEAIVFMDGDSSDDPNDMEDILKPILEGTASVVIGSRTMGLAENGSLGFIQKFGNWLSCLLLDLLYKVKFTDLGPFRAIRTTTLYSLEMQDPNFGWTVEMQAKIALKKISYAEVPVHYRNRRAGVSKVSGNLKGSYLAGKKILTTIFLLYILDFWKKIKNGPWLRFLGSFVLIVFGTIFIRKNDSLLIFGMVWAVFLLFPYKSNNYFNHIKFFTVTGILLRIPILFILPELSDDYYRTIWDANLIWERINPYSYTPREILKSFPTLIDRLGENLFANLNSPDYYSFYPPIQHGLAAISVRLGNTFPFGINLSLNYSTVFFLKFIFFSFDLWNMKLIQKITGSRTFPLAIYAWSPLIILEGVGNLHFELIGLSFLLYFIYLWKKGSILSSVFLGLSIWTKILPILFYPFAVLQSREKGWKFLIASIVLPILFLGIWVIIVLYSWEDQYANGIGLYSHSFEFFSFLNYGIRFLLASLSIPYPTTGLVVWIIFGIVYSIIHIRWIQKPQPIENSFLTIYGIFLLLSPVVHPWYLIPWLGLGILSGKNYPIIGSFLIYASYSYYHTEIYSRKELIVWTTYLLFFMFYIWELYEYKCRWNFLRNPSSSLRNFYRRCKAICIL